MIALLLCLFLSRAEYQLPKQYIIASATDDEFSERIMYAPFTKLTPQPLQLTSPYFENLFSTLSSVQSRTSGSPATSIRGSSQSGRVLYLLDNIPLNFLDGFGGSSLFVPTEILSGIYIFEGPSSAMYGPNAVGGSVHFTSQKKQSPMIRLGLSDTDLSFLPNQGGTLSHANSAFVTPVKLSDNYQLQASAFFEKDRGDYPFLSPNGQKDRRRSNDQSLRRFTLLGHSQWERLQLSHFLLYAGLNKTTPGSIDIPLLTEQKSDAGLAAISSRYKLSDSLVWSSRASYTLLHSDFMDSFGPSISKSDKFWLNQSISWQFLDGFLSQTTFDFNKNYFTASYVSGQKYERDEPEFSQTFVIPLTKRWTLEPSARFLAKYDETLFQINMPYSFDSAKIWLMYSEGFRPPALIDLYANEPFYRGNPNLVPETSNQVEAGLSWQQGPLDISSSIYQIQYKNLFQGTVDNLGVFSKRNAGEASSLGLSSKINLNLTHWKYHLGYSHLIAKEKTTRTPLVFSPEHQVFTSLTYQHRLWSLVAQQTLWSGFEDLDFVNGGTTRLPAWQGTDFLFFLQVTKKLSGNFGVYNVFNKRRELQLGYPEPQRRVALALEYNF